MTNNMDALLQAAKHAAEKAYSPYSHFAVGAALVTDDGSIFEGANIENASYSLCMCAERNAVFAAVFAGHKDITAICVYHSGDVLPYPCGSCLQVLSEFARDIEVWIVCDTAERRLTLSQLLPYNFVLGDEVADEEV